MDVSLDFSLACRHISLRSKFRPIKERKLHGRLSIICMIYSSYSNLRQLNSIMQEPAGTPLLTLVTLSLVVKKLLRCFLTNNISIYKLIRILLNRRRKLLNTRPKFIFERLSQISIPTRCLSVMVSSTSSTNHSSSFLTAKII